MICRTIDITNATKASNLTGLEMLDERCTNSCDTLSLFATLTEYIGTLDAVFEDNQLGLVIRIHRNSYDRHNSIDEEASTTTLT